MGEGGAGEEERERGGGEGRSGRGQGKGERNSSLYLLLEKIFALLDCPVWGLHGVLEEVAMNSCKPAKRAQIQGWGQG